MSSIPSTKSKLSFGLFKSKKSKDEAAASSSKAAPAAPVASAPAAQFDAAAPRAKNFRKLSVQIDQNMAQPKPASPAVVARVGLPSIDEVAPIRRHSAPATSNTYLTQRTLSKSEFKSLHGPEREAYEAYELANAKEPASRAVALHVEPLPVDFNVKIPTTFGPAGKSILKKSRNYNSLSEMLPRIDEKAPLPTPRRQNTVSSAVSDESFGGTLSRTVSFDRHTETRQKKLEEAQNEKEVIEAFRRAKLNDEKRKNARKTF